MTCKCSEQASAIDAFCASNEDPYPRPYLVGDGSEFTLLAEGTTLADYTDGAALDTRGISQVALYLKVRRNVDPGVIGALSVLPEAGILLSSGSYVWFPIAVINTALTIDGTPEEGYARRPLYESELLFDPTGGQDPVPTPASGTWGYAVPVDVTAWDHVRFRFAGRDGTVQAAVYAARRC